MIVRLAPRKKIPGSVSKPALGLSVSREPSMVSVPGAVVGDEEDRAAALAGAVAGQRRVLEVEVDRVAVEVDRAAGSPAGRAGPGGVGAAPDRPVVGEGRGGDPPRDADAAQRGAVAAPPAGEGGAAYDDRCGRGAGRAPAPHLRRRRGRCGRSGCRRRWSRGSSTGRRGRRSRRRHRRRSSRRSRCPRRTASASPPAAAAPGRRSATSSRSARGRTCSCRGCAARPARSA